MCAREKLIPKDLLLEREKLVFRPIVASDYDHIKKFRCSNGSMDGFLEMEAYIKHILREASTTLVFYGDSLIAYYTLHRAKIGIEPASEFVTQDALALARLAVEYEFQSKGLGTYIIREIIKKAYAVNEMYIITDAVFEKWEWYQTIGFKNLVESEVDPINPSAVVFMAFEFLDEDLINDYFDEDSLL